MLLNYLTRWEDGTKPIEMSRRELADEIEAFLNGTGAAWEWDDLCSARLVDPELERLRQECCDVNERFPATSPENFCSDEGMAFLRKVVSHLRDGAA